MDLFKKYDNNITYTIRAIKKGYKGDAKLFKASANYNLPNLHSLNKMGYNIFFTPNNNRFIFLDLDNNPTQKHLKTIEEYGAFLGLCSSEGHFQYWFYCPTCETITDNRTYTKYLITLFKGDKSAIQPIGRLPNYINQKEFRNKYKVKIIYTNKSLPLTTIKTRKKLEFQPSSLPSGVINKPIHATTGESQIEDRNDYAFIRYIIEKKQGKTRQDLINLLIKQSPRGQDLNYISRTVDNCLKRFS